MRYFNYHPMNDTMTMTKHNLTPNIEYYMEKFVILLRKAIKKRVKIASDKYVVFCQVD